MDPEAPTPAPKLSMPQLEVQQPEEFATATFAMG
jgi:hypothetical protein